MKLYSISNIRKARKDSVAEAGNDTGIHFSAISSVQTSGMSVTRAEVEGVLGKTAVVSGPPKSPTLSKLQES